MKKFEDLIIFDLKNTGLDSGGMLIDPEVDETSDSEFTKQINDLINYVSAWVTDNIEQFSIPYFYISPLFQRVLIPYTGEKFSIQPEDMLSKLNLDISQNKDFDRVVLNIVGLPVSISKNMTMYDVYTFFSSEIM